MTTSIYKGARGQNPQGLEGGLTPSNAQNPKGTVYMSELSKRTRLKTVRIRNEVEEYFRGKSLNRMIEDMYDYIDSGDIIEREGHIEVLHTRELRSECEYRRVDPQGVIDKLAKSLHEKRN